MFIVLKKELALGSVTVHENFAQAVDEFIPVTNVYLSICIQAKIFST